ncbi:unnamed protein product [Ilex paraguariensis]|uniref:Serine aminopeptidase S33 domain-containing protein n=1 Tax=Ilex paraguariensis TaxID=185542 RepID=A0ABC8TRY0_9AQUA
MFTQSWTPVSFKIRGLVVLLHGLNEHSGRYSDFAKQLTANGYKIYGMDWIGHGGSDGLHAYVHSLDDAVADMKSFLRKVIADNPGFHVFALDIPLVQPLSSRLYLTQSSFTLMPGTCPCFFLLVAKIPIQCCEQDVSRDPEALLAKYSDPLVYTGSIRVRIGYEILRIASYLQQNLSKGKVRFLVLHGTADTVTEPEASQKLYKEASSTDKTIKLYEGLLHDLLFEPERGEILKDIIEWLNCRT